MRLRLCQGVWPEVKVRVAGVLIECVQGNIADQPGFDVVVNAANKFLIAGSGVSGALHRAAGPDLEKECVTKAPVEVGQAVITNAYRLPNKYVIHCVGPIYRVNEPSEQLLTNCYWNALKLAEQRELESIAFPAISTGIYLYPMEEAAEVALRTVLELAPSLQHVKHIRFVLYDADALAIHERVLARLVKDIGDVEEVGSGDVDE